MRRVSSAVLAVVFACGPGILLGQQQSPKQSRPPQNKQDVPHQEPGTNNPDLGAQRQSTDTGTGTSTGSQQSHSKKKAKRGKKGSGSTQTGTSSH